ncbi:PI-actitoxin-Aeq3a [Taenia crassiceps]|uniref:PI-actitoxin-Aeq3a n=1 Tax=Taenia crassiceps TaxID=6207 RepID=A0ABR4Q6A6_9CEST
MLFTFAVFFLVAISFSEARVDPCKQPIEAGRCLGYFPKWGMNQEVGHCEEFIYGGCGGNLNQFDSKEQCELLCGR